MYAGFMILALEEELYVWFSSQTIRLGSAAECVTALAAVLALLFAICQVKHARASQREATAKQIRMNYELRAIEHTRFANPEIAVIDYERERLDGNHEEFLEYQWFVSFMLLACEEVLRLRGGPYWERAVDVKSSLAFELLGLESLRGIGKEL